MWEALINGPEPKPAPTLEDPFALWLGTPPAARAPLQLHANPHAVYQAGSGLVYRADEAGNLAVANENDARDLLRSGCIARR